MQRLPSRGKPAPLQNSKSFSRYEPPPQTSSPARSRASTTGSPPIIQEVPLSSSPLVAAEPDSDIFETPQSNHAEGDINQEESFADGYDELPIEIQSLMERFLESLVAKVHPAPLSIDRLSELYQDFYEHAYSQINTHIASLATRITRDASPTPSVSSARSTASRGSARRKPPDRKSTMDSLGPEHQMLTATEVADRRKARKQLEIKRLVMEEAIERGVCEKVYPRIWRHQSTDDEARDEKLRSRAAALNVVGVDLKELLSTALRDDKSLESELQKSPETTEDRAHDLLADARASLEQMNAERFPLGKLDRLTEAHKHIVEALQQLFPSASSADEVLPTLIYSIITTSPETNSVISNFNFIQKFRAASKVDGEAAYCLTNLEAAISFLENVDLSSIRSDELPQGPIKSPSQPSTPGLGTPDPLYRGLGNSPDIPKKSLSLSPNGPPVEQRRRGLSNLRPLEAASGAVHAAKSGADNVQAALDGGFRFLFGRMRELQSSPSSHGSPKPSAPKTLEEARKLVTPEENDPDLEDDEGENLKAPEPPRKESGLSADKLLDLVGGRLRDRSVDSSKSSSSAGKRFALGVPPSKAPPTSSVVSSAAATVYNPVEMARNFGNSINPLRTFSGMTMIRGFGRQTTPTPPTSSPSSVGTHIVSSVAGEASASGQATATTTEDEKFEGFTAPGFDWSGISPPLQRFVACKDARELNYFDVELLVRDYQRLVGAIRAATSPSNESN